MISLAAAKSTQRVRTSKLTAGHIQEKSPTNAHGKDARGVSLGRMNSLDISVNIPGLSHSNARTATDPFQDPTICHCT